MALECLLKNCFSGRGLPELHYTCPQIYFEEYLFEKHVFYFFFRFWQKDSRNLAKNLRYGCRFCVHATSRTFSAKADFFKLVFVTFVHWALIPGVSVEISEKGCQNCILRFQKCFLTFFSNIYNVITFSDFEKNTFHFLAKGFQKGCRTCLYESTTETFGEKNFFWWKPQLFTTTGRSFGRKFSSIRQKNGWSCRNCNLFVQLKLLRKKTFWKELILSLVSDFRREILDLLAKNVLVCVLVCVWEWGLPILHSTCLEKHFDKILVFEKIVVSSFFSILDGNFSIFLHDVLAGLFEPPKRRIWEARLFWGSFKILEILNFDRKNWRGCRNCIYLSSGSFPKFFWKKSFRIVNLAHPFSGFVSSVVKFLYRGLRKLHSTCLYMKILMKNQCFVQM